MENTKRCLTCGFDAKQEAKFCPRCGGNQFQAPAVQCPVCGAVVPQSQYCAHCGADLHNPGAQVWHNCAGCGNPVHITYTNCTHCGAPNLPPVQPRRPAQSQPKKKRNGAWALLLVIPLLVILVGIGIGVVAYLENEFPQLEFPGTTGTPWQPGTSQIAGSSQTPATTTRPQTPDTTTAPATRPETKPTQPQQTQPATKPTEPKPTQPKPTEPAPTDPVSNIPAEYQDNHYLISMGDGYCETMTGEMLVIFLYVNDPTDGWTDAEKAEAEPALLDELRTLLAEAQSYGAELNIRYIFLSVDITTEFSSDWDATAWKQEAMINAGLEAGYNDQRTMERDYNADQVPVVFLVDEPGRSYAYSYSSGNGFENVTILEKDYSALRHEMCHLFGAKDMYFPQETVQAAKQYLENGIMYGDCRGDIDDLTAFVIGWTDTLSANARGFLDATNSLTEEYIADAKAQDSLTGYGTKYYDDGDYYTGYMVNGVPHGEGTYYWVDGSYYTGTWVNGSREGYGELFNADGFSYKGQWKADTRHGTGTAVYAGGDSYVGDHVNGERHGKGTYYWADGSYYTGSWVNGSREGYGELHYADGYVYKGYWSEGDRNGYGELTHPDGYTAYTGDWKDDKRHGTGTSVYSGGDTYTGDHVNGNRHGKGKYTWANGAVYDGDWVDGQRTGKGTMTWADGSYYTGDWVDGYQHGSGEWYYASYGTRYVGDFVNGKREGYGTYYYADGTTYTGKWKNDSIAD